MRTRGALLATAGLCVPFCAASQSPVYISGPSIQATDLHENLRSISFSNARLYLAQRMGLADAYSLNNADDTTIELLNQAQGSQQPLATNARDGTGPRRNLVIVEGVQNPEAFFDKIVVPHFHIDKTPSMSDSLELVSTLLRQDRDKRGAHEVCGSFITTADIKDSMQGGFSTSDPLGTCHLDSIQSDTWWQGLSLADKLNVINIPASDIMSKIYKKSLPAWRLDDITGVFHIWTLHEIATRQGVSSSEYKAAHKTLRNSLEELRRSQGETTIMLSPYARGTGLKESQIAATRLARRADSVHEAAAASSDAASTIPRTTIPSCYSDEAACNSATRNCTGHGTCTLRWTEQESEDESGAECWACVCKATVVVAPDSSGKGGKTISWGGPACQKKDLSVPFWLFAGFGVLMAATISYGIGMLYSIGEAELPSVLGAGVASVGARSK